VGGQQRGEQVRLFGVLCVPLFPLLVGCSCCYCGCFGGFVGENDDGGSRRTTCFGRLLINVLGDGGSLSIFGARFTIKASYHGAQIAGRLCFAFAPEKYICSPHYKGLLIDV